MWWLLVIWITRLASALMAMWCAEQAFESDWGWRLVMFALLAVYNARTFVLLCRPINASNNA